ncbi:hypothetical protein VY88_03420 [Azospirillum thiophilum]|uniref:Uncharacterized protein n=1 Tax=Azospirillum thiophilum TaxID=528244 RepID=A0AAC8VX36_9PROT|nr:hypothetical protein [Azospirillum thiophilum]ALG71074.1 hypothetical protein AL072_09280 [Azospirillum thiophilum]KJR65266.1 hypothetical protein VY88_03420 [Azospirillum thiophilum]
MALVYVARSAALTKWASDVGQGKHIFKLAVAGDEAEAKAAIAAGWGGETDWKLVQSKEVEGLDEETAVARLTRREKVIDPTYYPRLKGAAGVFRITLTNVQNALLVAKAMTADEPLTDVKAKPKDIADYMIRNAIA